jgi:hypothetical protein
LLDYFVQFINKKTILYVLQIAMVSAITGAARHQGKKYA